MSEANPWYGARGKGALKGRKKRPVAPLGLSRSSFYSRGSLRSPLAIFYRRSAAAPIRRPAVRGKPKPRLLGVVDYSWSFEVNSTRVQLRALNQRNERTNVLVLSAHSPPALKELARATVGVAARAETSLRDMVPADMRDKYIFIDSDGSSEKGKTKPQRKMPPAAK